MLLWQIYTSAVPDTQSNYLFYPNGLWLSYMAQSRSWIPLQQLRICPINPDWSQVLPYSSFLVFVSPAALVGVEAISCGSRQGPVRCGDSRCPGLGLGLLCRAAAVSWQSWKRSLLHNRLALLPLFQNLCGNLKSLLTLLSLWCQKRKNLVLSHITQTLSHLHECIQHRLAVSVNFALFYLLRIMSILCFSKRQAVLSAAQALVFLWFVRKQYL